MGNRYDLAGRHALVTGSTQGIGLAIARLLASSGAQVLIHSADQAECEAAARTIPGSLPLAGDLSAAQACARLCERAAGLLGGRLDVLVHNAGIYPSASLEEQSLEEWQRVQRLNVESAFQITQGLRPCLIASGEASVIFISSAVIRMGRGDSPAYTTSKAAQIGLARHLAAELGPHGVRVNCVLPGLVDTPTCRKRQKASDFETIPLEKQMVPVKIQAEDIAHAVAFLASAEARAITAACLDVNGGVAVGG